MSTPFHRALSLAVCLAVALVSAPPVTAVRGMSSQTAEPAVRALWVTRTTLSSPHTVAQMVQAAGAAGFNTLIVQVRGRGDAYYQSSLEPRAAELAAQGDFDPLAETLALAHRAGMRVHAWLAVNLVSSAYELPASRQHVVYRQPEWLMVPRELAAELLTVDSRSPEYVGRLARWTRAHSTEVEGLYTSATHPAAAAHLAAVVTELAQRYPIDGVHLDYARYPNEGFDYSRTTLQQFKQAVSSSLSDAERLSATRREAVDALAWPNLFPEQWQTFRRSRLTGLVMRLRTALKTARPEAALSAAVVPDLTQAYESRLQDWRTWIEQSLIDIVCPMAYTREVGLFEQQIAVAQELAGERRVWAGVGAYRLSPAETLQHIAAARRLKTAGIILFSYDALISPPNSLTSLSQLGKAAFGAGSF